MLVGFVIPYTFWNTTFCWLYRLLLHCACYKNLCVVRHSHASCVMNKDFKH